MLHACAVPRRGWARGWRVSRDAAYGHCSVIVGPHQKSYGIVAELSGGGYCYSVAAGGASASFMGVVGLQGVSIRRGASRASIRQVESMGHVLRWHCATATCTRTGPYGDLKSARHPRRRSSRSGWNAAARKPMLEGVHVNRRGTRQIPLRRQVRCTFTAEGQLALERLQRCS